MNNALVTGKDYSITNLPKFWQEIEEILHDEKRLAILDFPEGGSLVAPDPVIPFGIYSGKPRREPEPAHPAPTGGGGAPGGQLGGHVTVDQFDPITGEVNHQRAGAPFFPDTVKHIWEGGIPKIGFDTPPEWKIGIDYGTPPSWTVKGGSGEACGDGYYRGVAEALLYAFNKENMMHYIAEMMRGAYPHLRDKPEYITEIAKAVIDGLPANLIDLATRFGMTSEKGYGSGDKGESYASLWKQQLQNIGKI